MYQFPDSSKVMEPPEPLPLPLKKGTSYRIIIIANLLLALLVVAVVWFVFFFKSESNNTPEINLSSTMKLIGDFTPIVIDDNNVAEPLPLLEKNDTIPSITETATKPISNGEIIDVQVDANSLEASNNDDDDAKKEKEQKHIEASPPLSAIDLIANELMKNQLTKTNQKLENDTPSPQLTTPTKNNDSSIIAQKEKQQDLKKTDLKKNQINLNQTTAFPLEELLQKTQQILNDSDKKLIAKINTVDLSLEKNDTISNIKEINNSKKHKSRNTDTYNSIPLNTGSDIDKIMAAMGDTKKSEDISAIDKLDKMVTKLLKNEENRTIETTQYIKKLQPETEENRKAIRTITVKKGEKLWDIAVRAYGDGNKYKKILQANPLLKTNPELLKAGATLRAPL